MLCHFYSFWPILFPSFQVHQQHPLFAHFVVIRAGGRHRFLPGMRTCNSRITLTWGGTFYTPPPPPTPENTLLGMGGGHIKEGGRKKLRPRGSSKYTHPPLLQNALWEKIGGGEGGGVNNFCAECTGALVTGGDREEFPQKNSNFELCDRK